MKQFLLQHNYLIINLICIFFMHIQNTSQKPIATQLLDLQRIGIFVFNINEGAKYVAELRRS